MKRSWPILRHYPGISLEAEENHETLSHDSLSPGHDLNPGPPEDEAGCSVAHLNTAGF
jgi:hypothetical protein